jgi:hypothetical protein
MYFPSTQVIMLHYLTSDSGGPTFFIPKKVFDAQPNVVRAVEMSNANVAEQVFKY